MRALDPLPKRRVRKTYRFRLLRMLGVALALAVGSELLIILGQNLFLKPAVASWGSVDHYVSADLLILRRESLLKAPISGRMTLLVSAGSRVRCGEPLAEIADPRRAKELTPEKRAKLAEYQRRLAETDRIVSGIQKELRILYGQREGAKPGNREEIEREIGRLAREMVRLRRQREDLSAAVRSMNLSRCSDFYRCLLAEEAGVFWPAVDGGEELPSGERYVPKPDDFRRRYRTVSPVLEQDVRQKQPVGKLITGWEETVVAWVKSDAARFRPESSQTCSLLLPDERRIDLEFLKSVPAPRGEFWFFRDSSLDRELLKMRRFSGTILSKKTFGVRIPRSALRKEKAGWTAAVSEKGKKRRVPVEVMDADDSWAIVKGLKPGTLVLFY